MRIGRWIALLLVISSVSSPLCAADLIHISGFENCAPLYPDGDIDTYGVTPGSVQSCPEFPGYARLDGDCDDANPSINPGAIDNPDGTFTDTNCDGTDGALSQAVLVATTGSNSSTCAAQAAPCATLAYAVSRATTLGRPFVFLQAGSYAGPSSIAANIQIFGGFDTGWVRGPNTQPANQVILTGGFDATVGQFRTLSTGSGTVTLGDLRIVGPNASGTDGMGNGRSSYAIHANTTTLSVVRLEVVQGNGSAGSNGTPGNSASASPPGTAGGGGNAGQNPVMCNDTLAGAPGNFASNAACPANTAGGMGGRGGPSDSNCGGIPPDYNAQLGGAGGDAASGSGAAGQGGPAGPLCAQGIAGTPGLVDDGSAGNGATNSRGLLAGNFWLAASGTAGTLGAAGMGGGGGGGSGGCDTGIDAYGAGGGGGGAGGCRASVAGGSGKGGGSSFGIFAMSSTTNVTLSVFTRGIAAQGGDGGSSGSGQPGGAGGPPGTGTNGAGAGGNGADGARGGHSGGGGGGAGGNSVAIFRYLGSLSQTGNAFNVGTAGARGDGGTGALPGLNGVAGQVYGILVCNATGAC